MSQFWENEIAPLRKFVREQRRLVGHIDDLIERCRRLEWENEQLRNEIAKLREAKGGSSNLDK